MVSVSTPYVVGSRPSRVILHYILIIYSKDPNFKTPFGGFKIHLYLKDYLTHEGVNLHMASVLVYLLKSKYLR